MRDAVLTRQRQPGTGAETFPFAAGPAFGVAGLVAVAHVLVGVFDNGYWVDEVYMLSVGRYHLDWGYVDQPPLVPLFAAVMDWIAPGSLIALRLPALAATAAAVVVTGLLARELGCDRRAQILTMGAYATALWATITGRWLTPYTIEPLQWLLLTWLLVRWIRRRDDRLLLILGVVTGLAMQTKFQIFLLCAVLIAGVLVFGPRELLRRPMFWGGAGIAALIAAPALVWQAIHGWPQLAMGSVVAGESQILSGGRLGTAVGVLSLTGIAGALLLIYGLVRLMSADELRQYRFLGAAFLVLYVFFVITAARPYYLTGLDGIALAAGALGLQRRREAGATRGSWTAWPLYAAAAALAVGSLCASDDPKLIPGIRPSEQMVQRTAHAYHALSPDAREHTAIMGESYIVTAFLDGYAPEYRIPNAYSTHRGYGYFQPPRPETDSLLYVGSDATALRPYFAEVRQLAGGETPLWLCTGRQESWSRLWAERRHL